MPRLLVSVGALAAFLPGLAHAGGIVADPDRTRATVQASADDAEWRAELASAEPTGTDGVFAAPELHRVAIAAGLASGRPPSLELAIRPFDWIELAFMAGGREGDNEPTAQGHRYARIGRASATLRVIRVVSRETSSRVALHVGAGIGHDQVGTTEVYVGPFDGTSLDDVEVYTPDAARTGKFGRADAGVTVAAGHVEVRAVVGIEGKDPTPFVGASLGLSFW